MKKKLFSLRSWPTMGIIVLAASFQWSCVEMEEPRNIKQSRKSVRERTEIPSRERNPVITEPGNRNPKRIKVQVTNQ